MAPAPNWLETGANWRETGTKSAQGRHKIREIGAKPAQNRRYRRQTSVAIRSIHHQTICCIDTNKINILYLMLILHLKFSLTIQDNIKYNTDKKIRSNSKDIKFNVKH